MYTFFTEHRFENILYHTSSEFILFFPFPLFNNPVRPPACPRWTHGAGCSKECKCVREHSSGCDPKTGSCVCNPSYHGLLCEKGIVASLIATFIYLLACTLHTVLIKLLEMLI